MIFHFRHYSSTASHCLDEKKKSFCLILVHSFVILLIVVSIFPSILQINEAITYTRLSLKHRSDFIHSLHLLTLLLSARKQHEDAMALVQAALEEYPDNLRLVLQEYSSLQISFENVSRILMKAKHLFFFFFFLWCRLLAVTAVQVNM